MTLRHLVLLAAACGLLALSTPAQAAHGYCGCSAAWHHEHALFLRAYHNVPAPPYFALYPPVYYSHVTPRAYGTSPFAHSPAGSSDHRAAAASLATKAPPAPLRIRNPYFDAELPAEETLPDVETLPAEDTLPDAEAAPQVDEVDEESEAEA